MLSQSHIAGTIKPRTVRRIPRILGVAAKLEHREQQHIRGPCGVARSQ